MVGALISATILAAVMSTFLFVLRSGANVGNYSDMEAQARKALEFFAEDVRQASAITWNTDVNITLVVNSANISYYYDSGTGKFFRQVGTGTPSALITGVSAGTFSFKAFTISGTQLPLATAANRVTASVSTKQLQISLESSRKTQTVVAATNSVLSARFILRNKIVTA